MTKEIIEKMMLEIEKNVGWLEDGIPKRLDDASLSTIRSILEINLLEKNET